MKKHREIAEAEQCLNRIPRIKTSTSEGHRKLQTKFGLTDILLAY